ncbi:MAG: hypothetical protein NT007_02130, partial [Candidatus Kapabacteria bacterium]|nr:hypothetical protein [Candidatus Kapabacteria bacterium]
MKNVNIKERFFTSFRMTVIALTIFLLSISVLAQNKEPEALFFKYNGKTYATQLNSDSIKQTHFITCAQWGI